MTEDTARAKRRLKRQLAVFGASFIGAAVSLGITAYAAPAVTLDFTPAADVGTGFGVLEIMFLFGIISLLPSIMLMMTSFTRIIIVLSFLRNALGTQQSPPTQVLVGLSLFLTLFIMFPVVTEIRNTAYVPYQQGTYTAMEAVEAGVKPLKRFMLKQTTTKSLNLYLSISNTAMPLLEEGQDPEKLTELSLAVVVPAFVTSELERAFIMGFLIFLPFLIIDMVVSSVLMSMGMVMLPPAMISMPFKILMFVLVDGWSLLLGTMVQSFAM